MLSNLTVDKLYDRRFSKLIEKNAISPQTKMKLIHNNQQSQLHACRHILPYHIVFGRIIQKHTEKKRKRKLNHS